MKPAPSRATDASLEPDPSSCAGRAVDASADFVCATVQVGWRWPSKAAAPATCGAAMLVPEKVSHVPSRAGTEERMPTPGAVTSGLRRSETGVGPDDEKLAIRPATDEAATAIARSAVAGELTVPRPNAWNSLPAETTGTTPAAAAPLSARVTRSRLGAISGSPSERLITSIPSRTAASIPAAISGEFPSSPTLEIVGTVMTR
jgi:hypothetical protein